MRLRSSLLSAAFLSALALPGGAQAASPKVPVPCAAAAGVSVGCDPASTPVPVPKPALPCPGQDVAPTAAGLAVARSATVCLVNRERAAHGMQALKPVGSLTAVADAYAKRMVRDNFFDHTAPNGSTFIARIKGTDYLEGALRRWSVGENIAWGTGDLATPEAIVKSWMASAGHRRNILTPSFNEIGLGVALGAPQRGVSESGAATYANEFGQRRR